jgi:hypothetical protein
MNHAFRLLLPVLALAVALAPPAWLPAEEKVLLEDRFDSGLGEGWSWLREHPGAWRVRDGALEIRVEPGKARDVKNALLRPAPDRRGGRFAIEVTVTNTVRPTQQYEQAGITWYTNGQPVFKLVKELIDGDVYIIPGRKPIEDVAVRLRLVVTADSWTAQYRLEGQEEFQTAAAGNLPVAQNDQVSLQCYDGPPEAEHWIRFDDFRVLQLPD